MQGAGADVGRRGPEKLISMGSLPRGASWLEVFASSVLQARAKGFNLFYSLRFLLQLMFSLLVLTVLTRSFLGPGRNWYLPGKQNTS